MVAITGSFLSIAVPEASAGRTRSPRRMTPSSILIGRLESVTVFGYCIDRAVHAEVAERCEAAVVAPAGVVLAVLLDLAADAIALVVEPAGTTLPDFEPA
jgi:hypothetical protein